MENIIKITIDEWVCDCGNSAIGQFIKALGLATISNSMKIGA